MLGDLGFFALTAVFAGVPGLVTRNKIKANDLPGAVIPIITGVVFVSLFVIAWITSPPT